jgi:hypothetical protein
MVRRTVLAIGILCGASAAAALAFGSGISRVGHHLVVRGAWTGRGVTTVPASGMRAHGSVRAVAAPAETPQGEYCRFPPRRGSEATAVPTDAAVGGTVGSTPLVLQAQSRIPDALLPALCPGDTAGPPVAPILGKP